MASYRGHLKLSTPLGVAYGALWLLNPEWAADWAPMALGAGVCTVGGLLPDLDSDSGVPVRELFGIGAAAFSAVAYFPLRKRLGLTPEQALVIVVAVYFLIRYGVSELFSKMTVHRGMFHSLPAMVIAGLVVYLLFPSENVLLKLYLAGGVMVGFLSHLVLDEIYAVDFMGASLRFNKFAGSAVKFGSSSWPATLTCYAIMFALGYVAWEGTGATPEWAQPQNWKRPAWLNVQKQAQNLP
jgi:membrane-bound metal-dependent hydrolase YbcI (DUF457 family)